jgi:hypothetical protein
MMKTPLGAWNSLLTMLDKLSEEQITDVQTLIDARTVRETTERTKNLANLELE